MSDKPKQPPSINVNQEVSEVQPGGTVIGVMLNTWSKKMFVVIIMVLIGLFILSRVIPTVKQSVTVDEPIAVILPTDEPTAIPSPTPLPFTPATIEETLIVILPFDVSSSGSSDAHLLIFEAIETAREELGMAELRVEIDPYTVLSMTDKAGAQASGEQYGAAVVIWGAETRTSVKVNFLNVKAPDLPAGNERVQVNAPESLVGAEFIEGQMPKQLAFLALYAIGQATVVEGNMADAIPILESAVHNISQELIEAELTSGEAAAAAYFLLGWLYQVHIKNNELAIANYSQAIDYQQDFAQAYYNRGIAYFDSGQLEEAVNDFEASIQIEPKFAEAYYYLGNSYRLLNQFDEAIANFDQAIQLDASLAVAFYGRGDVYFRQQNYDAAILDFSSIIALDNDQLRLDAYYSRSLAYYAQNKMNLAIADLDIILDAAAKASQTDQYRALILQGIVFENLGQFELAIANYQAAITLNPQDASGYNALAWLYANTLESSLDEAISLAKQAIALTQNDNHIDDRVLASYIDTLGWAYYKAEQLDLAVEQLEQAIELCQNADAVCVEIQDHIDEVVKAQ